jgi:uncharacterized LabA/DUF88 family protein
MIGRERVAIFIDGSNFYFILKEVRQSPNIDFEHLVRKITGPQRQLVRVYYYNAPVNREEVPDQYARQQRFFAGIRSLDYFEVKLGRLVRRPDAGMVEKGVDVKLAVDMVGFAVKDTYDTAVLISADGDFADAVQYVKDMGKHVEVAYPPTGKLQHLREICDRFIALDDTYLLERARPN